MKMLLKLILIICLLVSVSLGVKVESHSPAKFTSTPIISGSSGNTGANPCYDEDHTKDPAQFTDRPIISGSGSGSGTPCPRHHTKDPKDGGKKDTSVEQPKERFTGGRGSSGSSGSGCGATGSTGTGSGRTTQVNDGVTYKASNIDNEDLGSTSTTGCGEITGW